MSRYDRVRGAVAPILQQMCDEAHRKTGADVGGRIWMLPPWYIAALHRSQSGRMAWAEVGIRLFDRPRMISLAKVFGGAIPASSDIAWSVRKGLPGNLPFHKSDFDVQQHADMWPSNLDTMSEREWNRMPEQVRQGRKLEDARRLKQLYGTVVGFKLVDPESLGSLGCLTLHTSSNQPLSAEATDVVVPIAATRTHEISRQIISNTRIALR